MCCGQSLQREFTAEPKSANRRGGNKKRRLEATRKELMELTRFPDCILLQNVQMCRMFGPSFTFQNFKPHFKLTHLSTLPTFSCHVLQNSSLQLNSSTKKAPVSVPSHKPSFYVTKTKRL
ncbi:hypothetical protein FQA47_016190 [Oryzias melastigma]|uniref:Uncharacterized protein n=1 Tax=Oryzias melastigma TaxID=30732 RepID=A0A834EYT8_ORYME|nr:hypothetical protein FQA47_016190 [Oryzias melastigma]